MADEVCNVFISHIHEDDGRIAGMKDLLAQKGCTARDSSINSSRPNNATDAEYIKREILAPGINWAGTLVVLISEGTHASDWVNWEIEYAHAIGKRIVGVWDFGATDADLPEALDKYADAIVGWQGDRIIDAIFGRLENWEGPDGQPISPREIAHHRC